MKKGDIVTIRNTTIGGKKIIEGTAKLIRRDTSERGLYCSDPDRWIVEFNDEPGSRYSREVLATDIANQDHEHR